MMTVWKFPLDVVDFQTIKAPIGSKFLSVQIQGEDLVVWMLVDSTMPQISYQVDIVGTGNPITRPLGRFLGTIQTKMFGSNLVWHVFVGEPDA